MSDIAEARAALKRARDAIILDNSGSALDAIDDALDALYRAILAAAPSPARKPA